jgi:small-conductance mechanosensitive channel
MDDGGLFNWGLSFDFSALITGALKVLLIVVVTLVVLWIARRVIRRVISSRIPRVREEKPDELASRSETLSKVIIQVLSFIVWVIALMMILGVLGVNITPILAAVGVAGLAVGFAAQNIIRDYIHGFFIVMEDWYRVGEVATVAGISGVVEVMNLRRTILRDINGSLHNVPNSNIALASNLTRDWARINLDISVAYKENLGRVVQVINDVCQKFKDDEEWGKDMLTIPEVVRVNNLGDNGVELKILGDTKPMRQWALMGELRRRLKDRFDEEGIEIPWPHTKVYFGNTPAGKEALS